MEYVSHCVKCGKPTEQTYEWIKHNLDPDNPVVIEIGLECNKCEAQNVILIERRPKE